MCNLVSSYVLPFSDPKLSHRLSPSKVKPAYTALGELAAVLDTSGVVDLPLPAPCAVRCGGIGRGGEGEAVECVVLSDGATGRGEEAWVVWLPGELGGF